MTVHTNLDLSDNIPSTFLQTTDTTAPFLPASLWRSMHLYSPNVDVNQSQKSKEKHDFKKIVLLIISLI